MGRGWRHLNEREEGVDKRACVRYACELGKAEALGETLKEQEEPDAERRERQCAA